MPNGKILVVVGVQEFNDRLEQMAYRARQVVLMQAVKEGAKLIAEEMEHLAPRSTGRLRSNIAMTIRQPTATQAVARIGPSINAFYGKFRELGTVFQSPFPFMHPAFENKVDEAFAVTMFKLVQGIERKGF